MTKIQRKRKEKHLAQLVQQYQRIWDDIHILGYAVSGSVVKRTYKCGKPTCRCQKDPTAMHGPYYQWTRKLAGKTVGMNLDKQLVSEVKKWIQNGRTLRRFLLRQQSIVVEMMRIKGELLNETEDMEDQKGPKPD